MASRTAHGRDALADLRKFCSACRRESMSAISAEASSYPAASLTGDRGALTGDGLATATGATRAGSFTASSASFACAAVTPKNPCALSPSSSESHSGLCVYGESLSEPRVW